MSYFLWLKSIQHTTHVFTSFLSVSRLVSLSLFHSLALSISFIFSTRNFGYSSKRTHNYTHKDKTELTDLLYIYTNSIVNIWLYDILSMWVSLDTLLLFSTCSLRVLFLDDCGYALIVHIITHNAYDSPPAPAPQPALYRTNSQTYPNISFVSSSQITQIIKICSQQHIKRALNAYTYTIWHSIISHIISHIQFFFVNTVDHQISFSLVYPIIKLHYYS